MKPQPLKLVIEHYRRLRDDAVAVQARVRLEMSGAERTLQTLQEYRDEQLERARDCTRTALSTTHLLLQTRFSGKLDEAIALQNQRLIQIQERVAACRSQVLALQQRLKAIETIEDQRATRLAAGAARSEQLATDERAANAHSRGVRQDAGREDPEPYHSHSSSGEPVFHAH
jgi:flagellar export protein FliJ